MSAAAAVLALALTAGAPTVSPWEYTHVHTGDTRHRVETIFDTHGTRLTAWYGPRGWEHLAKSYPAEDGGTVTVIYTRGPRQTTYRLHTEERSS